MSVTGPRPLWWRPFARRRWDRAVRSLAVHSLIAEYLANAIANAALHAELGQLGPGSPDADRTDVN